MTGSIALDVVIGLSFMFLLYSLFATILMEIISNSLGLRARNLEYSIKRMLRDEGWKDLSLKVWKINISLAGKNKLFALVWGIFKSIIGPAKIDKLLKIEKGDLFEKFYGQPSVKYLSHGGFFSKPSYMSAENFSKALIDSLKEDQPGATPLAKIQNGINSILNSDETKAHIKSLLDDANNDLQKFKLLVENWFDDTQERAIGWFKRNNQYWLLAIGFTMAVSFNASTLQMAKKLAHDKDAREQMVQMAIVYAESTPAPDSADRESVQANAEERLKLINEEKAKLQQQIDDAQSIIGLKSTTILWPWKVCFWEEAGKDFWGYLLTALAISLGAPFWFDLLNKLVKLRGSVQHQTKSAKGANPGKSDQSILDVKG